MEENEKQELAAQVLQLARSEENEIDDTVMQKQQHSNKRLPEPVTIPKTGPLVLKSSSKLRQMYSSSLAPASQRGGGGGGGGGGGVRRFVNPFDSQTLRPKHSLTRFPVVLLQRPIEQIENNLGKISCAELKDNIQLLTERSAAHTLPHLHPMMTRHSSHHRYHGSQTTAPTGSEIYTHRDQGPMDVSITYSRHTAAGNTGSRTETSSFSQHHRSFTYPIATSSTWLLGSATVQQQQQPTIHRPVLQPTRENARYSHILSEERQKKVVVSNEPPLSRSHSSQLGERQGRGLSGGTRVTRTTGANLPPPPPLQSSHPQARGFPPHLPGHTHLPSIAPASVRAAALHRVKPITTATVVRGRSIQPMAPGCP